MGEFRRVRTFSDQFLVGNGLLSEFDNLTVCCGSDIALDHAAWNTRTLASARSALISGIQERRDEIAKHTSATEIPPSQSAAPAIVINEIQYHPATDGNAEYVELYNPSATESVDLSGWTLDGVGSYTIKPGTVVLPHGYVVFVKNDPAFRALYGGDHFVGGQYPGALDDSGDTLTLSQGSRVVDTVTYTPTDPWPAAADGTGPSLELKDAASDNSDPASWAVSTNSGTPAAPNTVSGGTGGTTTVAFDFGSSWKYLATGPDQGTAWRMPAFNDSSWPSGIGSLGFKNAVTTTIPATSSRTTYYFRKAFTVAAGAAPTSVSLDLKRDDGAVVYLNGVEVARSNMPAGTVKFTTKAAAAVNGADETTPVTIALPAGSVAVGANTIAVEVHQKTTGAAGDLTMDARLSVSR
jgi:Lamin Tail Domain